jgi:signal transduction histidine kinase
MSSLYKIVVFFTIILYSIAVMADDSGDLTIVINRSDKAFLDSLYGVAETTDVDTVKAFNYLKISIALGLDAAKQYKNISGTGFFNMATSIAVENNKVKDFIRALDDIGVRNRRNGKFKVALRFHMAALSLLDSVDAPGKRSVVLNNIGVVFRRIDDYQNALYYHMEALKIADSLNDSRTKAMAMNSVGNVYVALNKLDDALSFFKKSLSLEYDRKNKLGIAINLNNIGSVYQAKGDLSKAYEYYKISLDVNKEINSLKGIGICHADIGDIYYEKNKLNDALNQYVLAENIFSRTNDKMYLANSLLKAGKVYIALNMFDKALESLQKALVISKEIGKKVITKEADKWIAEAYKKMGDYKLALSYFEESNRLQDSINNIAIQKSIIRMQIKYDLEAKENEIALLQQMQQINTLELRKQKTANLLMLVIIFFILVVMFFLFYAIHTRNRRNKLLEDKNEEIEQARAELKKYSEDLLAAKHHADKSNKAKSVFLANMSHEFRTPLNSVIGYADLMFKNETDPAKRDQLEIIKTNSQSLLVLLNDILDLSKIEAGKLVINYQPVNVVKTIDEVYQLFKLNTDKKGIKFSYSVQKGFPETIVFSEIRLRQILFNLVGNAVKFTDNGEVMIDALFEDNNDGTINFFIEIKDTGLGIEKSDIDKIFKPFVQLGKTESSHGTGLGLTITKRLAESLGGKLSVDSEVGKGTCFSIKFYKVGKEYEKIIKEQDEQKIINVNRNSVKTLFLCSDAGSFVQEYELLNSLTDSLVRVDNDLMKAKSVLHETGITVICNGNADFTINALKVLNGSVDIRNHWFVVLSGDDELTSVDLPENTLIIDRNIESLEAVFKKLSFDMLASKEFDDLLSCNDKMKDNVDFMTMLNEKLLPAFELALESKLMNNIKAFSYLLQQSGEQYKISSFIKLADALNLSIQRFEIVEIERLLNYFNDYCLINLHK